MENKKELDNLMGLLSAFFNREVPIDRNDNGPDVCHYCGALLYSGEHHHDDCEWSQAAHAFWDFENNYVKGEQENVVCD